MNDKFFDLKKEKQDRIINAALKVFALNGYRNASTDEIVKEAGISKGLLFHYFENKIGVYTFLFDYSARYTILELKSNVEEKEHDLFEIMRQVEFSKLLTMRSHPFMQMFLKSCMKEDIVEALIAIDEKRTVLTDLYDEIYRRADSANLAAHVDLTKMMNMMKYTIDGLTEKYCRSDSCQTDKLFEEISAYIHMAETMAKRA